MSAPIPEDILRTARNIARQPYWQIEHDFERTELSEWIAGALRAERERCAKIALETGSAIIASAIRVSPAKEGST